MKYFGDGLVAWNNDSWHADFPYQLICAGRVIVKVVDSMVEGCFISDGH